MKHHSSSIEPLEARIAPAFAAVFELSSLDGLNGFAINGVATGDSSGFSVSSAGDVNGDGFNDVIIGAINVDPNGSNSGASYVVFGGGTGFPANLNLATLDGSNGFKLSGVAPDDSVGASVSAAGDVNGDGFDDLIIGAGFADPNGLSSGASYVVFGKATGFAPNLNLSTLNGSDGFKLSGVSAGDFSGGPVSGAGDVNHDGFDDLIIGASFADPNGTSSGASYVVFGKASGFAANVQLSALNGSNGFKLSGGAAGDFSGASVSGAGDVNGDGFDDLIIGADLASPTGSQSGASYVVFGKAGGFSADFNLSTLDGVNGFRLNGVGGGDGAGGSVSGAGDVNGDGFADLIVGAAGVNDDTGASYVVFGKASGFAASLNLSTLDGTNGFSLNGISRHLSGAYSRVTTDMTSAAGDVNGDGFDDVIIGAQGADPNGNSSGASYVVFGKASGFAANLNVSTLDASNGFKLNGVAAEDRSGFAVSGGGDLNNDGLDDVIIGALFADPNGSASGASYVVFGQKSSTLPSISIGDATAAEGDAGTSALTFPVTLSSASTETVTVQFSTVDGTAGAGSDYIALLNQTLQFAPGETTKTIAVSINGDSAIELDETFSVNLSNPANATIAEAQGIGRILNDDSAFPAVFELSSLDGSNGLKLSGVAEFDFSGHSVSDAGDVNGDGFGDLIIGAFGADPNGSLSGASYVVFGKASGFAANLNLSTLDGSNGFKLSGVAANDSSGRSVSAAGDLNGDGFGDLIIGADGASAYYGASYVVFGKASGFAANLNLSALNGSNGFKLSGYDQSGFSVSAAGDVNGDGFGDVIIGAPLDGGHNGASYVVFGKASGFVADLRLSTLDGSDGFKLSGVASGDFSGYSVSAAGDVNGDDFGDLIIGADFADPNGDRSGASYVVFGKPGAFAANLDLSMLDGSNGFKLSGSAAGDFSGESVSAAGDVNGDGFGDLVVGAFQASPNGGLSGASYVVFGKGSGFTANLNFSTLDGSSGFKLSGVAFGDYSGRSVSAAGDVNGDGLGDLIIGAHRADPNGSDSGTSYVVFGKASGFAANLNLSTLDGISGFKLNGVASGDASGRSVSAAGDINGDGFGDVVIGAPGADPNGDSSGASYVVFGQGPGLPSISIGDATGAEGDAGTGALTFAVTLGSASTQMVTVQFSTVDGTATAGSDYTARNNQTLEFAPGETTKTIIVEVLGDTSIEDYERFSLALSGARGATIGNGTATGTILNDDTAIRISDASGAEGDSGTSPFAFTVSLEKASALPVTVSYATADGTANAGSDFTAAPADSQLTFAPGEITKTITVEVIGDTAIEADETFSVVLSGATNATLADGTGTGTILDDDTVRPLVQITDASVLEGHSGTRAMTFTVSLSAETTVPVSVNFASADGTATAGADYIALPPGTLTYAPGETTKTLTVEVRGDITPEPKETFSVVLSEATNADIQDGTGIGTILDDDVTLTGPHKATFTDADGELVTIKVSKGTLKVEDFTIVPTGIGAQLALVDFSGETEFAGTKLSISAKAPPGVVGDHFANVGYINATGIDLGKVRVKGDLGQIDAGDGDAAKPALKVLSVASLGARGLNTQEDPATASLHSDVVGDLRKLSVKMNIADGVTLAIDGRLGSAKIGGNFDGATISALGLLNPAKADDALAIGSVTVGGNVSNAQILAGYDRTGTAANADASIGKLLVGRDWTASNLIAGASAGPDGLFGTDDDALIPGGNAIVARIASILIKGTANGTAAGADHFGFVAEQIAAFEADGAKFALTPGASNDLGGFPVGPTGDTTVREVVWKDVAPL